MSHKFLIRYTVPLRSSVILWSLAFVVVFAVGGCEKPTSISEVDGIKKKPGWAQKTTIGRISNLSVAGGFYLGGQPKEDDFELLMNKGIKTVISLRTLQEFVTFNEKKLVSLARINFINVPFRKADNMSDEVIGRLRGYLSDTENHPILLHCGSADRTAAIWMIRRVLDNGWTLPEALAEAKEIGLRTPELEQRAKEYIKSKQASP